MGWEKRDKHHYYYRKVRAGRRVVSHYVGDDAEAVEQALTEVEQRAHRRTQREALREQMELDEVVTDFDHLVSAIVTGAYLAVGYYCHHREWRKARRSRRTASATRQRKEGNGNE